MACFSAKGDNSTFMVNSKLHLQANLFPRIKELICLETIISGGGGVIFGIFTVCEIMLLLGRKLRFVIFEVFLRSVINQCKVHGSSMLIAFF